jgi:hypothetical protein
MPMTETREHGDLPSLESSYKTFLKGPAADNIPRGASSSELMLVVDSIIYIGTSPP